MTESRPDITTVDLAAARQMTRAAERYRSLGGLPTPLYYVATAPSTMELVISGQNGQLSPEVCFDLPFGSPSLKGVALAREQVAGRGRSGRAWHSPPGTGVYTTLRFETRRTVAEVSQFSLVIGLAVVEYLLVLGGEARLKWPNDVWLVSDAGEVQGKIAGILCESSASQTGTKFSVGIGLNLKRVDLPVGVKASFLSDVAGLHISYEEAFLGLVNAVTEASELFFATEFSVFHPRVQRYSALTGREVTITETHGKWSGIVRDIAEDGGLRLEVNGSELRTIYAGDASIGSEGL